MKIIYFCGEMVGGIGMLLAKTRSEILQVVSYSHITTDTAKMLGLPCFDTRGLKGKIFTERDFLDNLDKCDFVLCVHGKDIFPKSVLDKKPCINVHPCYKTFKGANPITRLLREHREDGQIPADVTAFHMTEKIDDGPEVNSVTIGVEGSTPKEIYNDLYPYYVKVINNVFNIMEGKDVQQHVWKTDNLQEMRPKQ